MAFLDPMLDPTEKFSINTFPGNGVTVTWDLNFSGGYIRREHIKAYVEGPTGSTTPVTLVFEGPNTITVEPPVATFSTLVVYRDTPKGTPLVDFSDGAIINEANLDLLAKQSVFVAAEMVDRFADVAADAGEASELAIAASASVVTALEDAAAAVLLANEASALSSSVAAQFTSLLATVQDLAGEDLSLLARLNLPQTYTAQQTFPSIRLVGSGLELELLPNRTYRTRNTGGAWSDFTLNDWASISGKPLTFAPAPHTHPWGEIFDKPTTFPPTAHTHSFGSLTGLPSAFPPTAHTHTWSEITGKPAVAVLDQPANFTTLSIGGTRVVAITVSTGAPVGGVDGDIHFTVP